MFHSIKSSEIEENTNSIPQSDAMSSITSWVKIELVEIKKSNSWLCLSFSEDLIAQRPEPVRCITINSSELLKLAALDFFESDETQDDDSDDEY